MKTDKSGSTATAQNQGSLRSWVIVVGIAASFFLWGLLIFFAVGDKEPPPWDFGVVADIPGESPYAEYGPQFVPGKGAVVVPQHVMEGPAKPPATQQGGQ